MAAASQRVVCVNKSTHVSPTGAVHGHIVGVGLGVDASTYTELVSVAAARARIAAGTVLYTVSPSTGNAALVQLFTCCSIGTLRSHPDAVTDNNLDNLPACAT
jgi:hypothetical protein